MSSLAVFKAAMWVKSSDKIMSKNQKKKRKYGNKRNFYINLHLKDCFGMEFTAF